MIIHNNESIIAKSSSIIYISSGYHEIIYRLNTNTPSRYVYHCTRVKSKYSVFFYYSSIIIVEY